MNRDDVLLTEDMAIKAYEKNNPADDHATGVVEVAKAQTRKLLALLNETCPHYPKIDGKKVKDLEFRRRECPICMEQIEKTLGGMMK